MITFLAIVSKLPVTLLLVFSALSVVAGDFFGKYWSGNQKTIFFLLALAGYFGSSIFYLPTLLREGLVTTSLRWSLLSDVGFIIIGLIIFRETLSPLQVVGVFLGFVALVILTLA